MGLPLLIISLFTFVELNCENLFDCRHDSLKNDIEFTPEGDRNWTERKYWDKINNIAKEILSCGIDEKDSKVPDLVALSEVENDNVLRDLTKRSLLKGCNYEYVMTDSPDWRGVDVALLYQPGTFALVNHHSIRVKPSDKMRPTRDILYVSGRTITGDTLHVFVVHAPSMYGGEKLTRQYRQIVMEQVGASIDSLRSVTAAPKIIVSGDFNDYSDNIPLKYLYGFGMTNISKRATGRNGAKGTYKYKGKWDSLDHILISDELKDDLASCDINDVAFVLEEDDKYGGVQPFRTYRAWKYRKGYSDHLPLVARFNFRQKQSNHTTFPRFFAPHKTDITS